jgi:ERCC4-type nuclease
VRIIVDEREKGSGVPENLARLGAYIEYRMLETADYIFEGGAV